ncbi:MAG: tetratricopeptide repeat protein [Gemmatimonadota bacterium]
MIFRNLRESSESEPDLQQRLESLERQAEIALPGSDAQFYNRAGDLCIEAGRSPGALEYYGRAIDAYLQAGRYNAAGAVCRKLLRISPGAVRARCTLAWLSIGKGLLGDARREVDDYVAAAVAAGEEGLARTQLRLMADASADRELRALLAEHLRKLGDTDTAERIMATDPVADGSPDEIEARWTQVVEAALMGPAELRDEDREEG